MADVSAKVSERQLNVRHRGRLSQIGIYFGKFIRMFVYQSDWKVIPMAAIIAGLVGFVMAGDFRISMEGTIMGSFAMVCVCIWNGCFNSIQVVCRERNVVKREHRSGMHISSYILSHMMYQLLLCILQTIVTLGISNLVGMSYAGKGLVTPWLALDIAITMFLVTYASDMLSLWISTLCHSTTTAMTVMPFVLIFQLIFSGGLIPLPEFVTPITMLTISAPGIKAMAAQTEVNTLPYAMVGGMIDTMGGVEFGGTITVGEVLDLLKDEKNPYIAELRSYPVEAKMTVAEILKELASSEAFSGLRGNPITNLTDEITLGDVLDLLTIDQTIMGLAEGIEISAQTNLGEVLDYILSLDSVKEIRDKSLTIDVTVDEILDVVGRDEVMKIVEKKASEANYNPDYASTAMNVWNNWIHILIFVVVFALASVITLEFIDKDKR